MLNKLGVRDIRLSLSALSIMVAIFFAFHIPAEAEIGEVQGVIGFWQFEEQEGIVVGDSSGTGNDGEIQGACEWVAEGRFGGALQAGGAEAWVYVPNEAINESLADCTIEGIPCSNNLTMAAWVKLVDYAEAGVAYIIAEGGAFFLGNYPNSLSSPGIELWGWHGAGGGEATEMGTWHHLAGTFDGVTLIAYADGEKVGESAEGEIQGIKDLEGAPPGIPLLADDIFCLGTCGWHPGGGAVVIMDQALMADYAFTEDEIKYLYENGVYEGYVGAAVEPAGKLSTTWSSIKSKY